MPGRAIAVPVEASQSWHCWVMEDGTTAAMLKDDAMSVLKPAQVLVPGGGTHCDCVGQNDFHALPSFSGIIPYSVCFHSTILLQHGRTVRYNCAQYRDFVFQNKNAQ